MLLTKKRGRTILISSLSTTWRANSLNQYCCMDEILLSRGRYTIMFFKSCFKRLLNKTDLTLFKTDRIWSKKWKWHYIPVRKALFLHVSNNLSGKNFNIFQYEITEDVSYEKIDTTLKNLWVNFLPKQYFKKSVLIYLNETVVRNRFHLTMTMTS